MFSLGQIAELIKANLVGDPDCVISGISTIQDAAPGDITFLDNPGYRKHLPSTKASAVILAKDMAPKSPVDVLIVGNPYFAYAKVSELFKPQLRKTKGIHPTAVVASDVDIADDVSIGPNVVIEHEAQIESGVHIGANSYIGERTLVGAGTRLHPNVTVYHDCQIGNDCEIHSGVVIGSDGFGMAKDRGRWHEIAQLGRVVIGNNVSIGACSSIDRGAISDTILKDGVKIDNQVQIGHNVVINEHTVIAGCSGVAGSTTIGEHCIIGGDVGIVGHLNIADNVSITGATKVFHSIKSPDVYSSGMPVQSNREWHKTYVRLQQLDKLAKRVKNLERQLESE